MIPAAPQAEEGETHPRVLLFTDARAVYSATAMRAQRGNMML